MNTKCYQLRELDDNAIKDFSVKESDIICMRYLSASNINTYYYVVEKQLFIGFVSGKSIRLNKLNSLEKKSRIDLALLQSFDVFFKPSGSCQVEAMIKKYEKKIGIYTRISSCN